MSAIDTTQDLSATEAPGTGESPRLWGLDLLGVHDRLWAGRAVCVVRPGTTDVPVRGPGLYLLLRRHQLVDFSISSAREELFWSKVDALHVRLVGPRARRHDEVIRVRPDGSFVEIRRLYLAGRSRSTSVWVTASPDLARVWAAAEDRRATAELKSCPQLPTTAPHKLQGTILDPDDEEAASSWLCEAVDRLGRMSAVLPSVYQFQSGVWAHELAQIGRSVRFAGPALVGAGAIIPANTTVIGPIILPDAGSPPSPPEVDWGVLSAPFLRIVPTGRPGSLYAITKRAFDIVASLVVLAVLSLLSPLIMLAIFIEDGRPFFFAHMRQSLGGREFPCYKFRTMIKDAEGLKAKLAGANQADGPQFFIANDPRLLRVGKWLRRFQIDELPQFWNVLRGDMSLVGPRPSPDRENQFCPAWRDARLSVRPGITGLWQVRRTRAPDTDFQEWIRYDFEYVQRRSWRLDLWIIVLTVRRVLFNG